MEKSWLLSGNSIVQAPCWRDACEVRQVLDVYNRESNAIHHLFTMIGSLVFPAPKMSWASHKEACFHRSPFTAACELKSHALIIHTSATCCTKRWKLPSLLEAVTIGQCDIGCSAHACLWQLTSWVHAVEHISNFYLSKAFKAKYNDQHLHGSCLLPDTQSLMSGFCC